VFVRRSFDSRLFSVYDCRQRQSTGTIVQECRTKGAQDRRSQRSRPSVGGPAHPLRMTVGARMAVYGGITSRSGNAAGGNAASCSTTTSEGSTATCGASSTMSSSGSAMAVAATTTFGSDRSSTTNTTATTATTATTGSTRDFLVHLACASTACCLADAFCLPLDLLKVRMQLQNEMLPPTEPRLGVVAMALQISRSEGLGAFYAGWPAAMLRQATYGGLVFAMYTRVRDVINQWGNPHATSADAPLWTRVAAGVAAGGAASALANPTDVVKVRMQADGRLRQLLGTAPRYEGALHAFRAIGAAEGLGSFWRGAMPNMARAAVVGGVGVSAYDHTKQV
jgi:hypothetical protein